MAAQVDDRPVQVPIGDASLAGDLRIPNASRAIVVFAHGSGSSRLSPRNRFVADVLVHDGLATLLIDLLTQDEESIDIQTAELRFNIPLLAERLGGVTEWLATVPQAMALSVGYFGASTGAAAALIAAADRPDKVGAIVSRGGRPDLALPVLRRVRQPTLLIVGGADDLVLDLNRQALRELAGPKQLAIVPGATHLFEEPGALEQVAALASDWFRRHLADRG
ncbi:MAG TPA: dienelactone hydrolase family protein [Candidatus Limnocylindrales bacterium]|nr:dienelactone hydrolase family protein [Candidatus Limnocylindrales bacterium]